MAIPNWVLKNSTTRSLVPLMKEAEAAGYTIDFGPTGKKHPSGKKVAADIHHGLKRIRLDVNQINKDFDTRAWTKPQVEGVNPIEHDFANAGELAHFYLSHELEHMNPDRRPDKADNENATNERAMKRMLPKPKVLRGREAVKASKNTTRLPEPEKPVDPAGKDLVPHSHELIYALQGLGRKSTSKNIKSVIDGLVGEGKVRPGAARLLGTAVVFAQDRLRGVSEGQMVTAGTKPIDEIYFEGTPQQLKDARMKSRNTSRSFYSSSLPPELGKVITEAFRTKEGKQHVMRALRSRLRSGKVAPSESAKGMLKEAQKDVKTAPEMSVERGPDAPLKPFVRKAAPKNRRVLLALPARGPEDAEYMERSQGSPERIHTIDRSMIGRLAAGMTSIDKKKFEKIKKRIAEQYPDYTEPKVNRIALIEMYPHYERFTRNYGRKVIEGAKSKKQRAAEAEAREMAEDVKTYRSASGRTQRTDSPAMTGPAGVIALRKLAGKFGGPTANPSPRRSKRTVLK